MPLCLICIETCGDGLVFMSDEVYFLFCQAPVSVDLAWAVLPALAHFELARVLSFVMGCAAGRVHVNML